MSPCGDEEPGRARHNKILEMEQNAPCFSPHILWIWIILPMYHDFLGPRGLQGTHMDTSKPKKFKNDNIHYERGGFFTFFAILAHSVPPVIFYCSIYPDFFSRCSPNFFLIYEYDTQVFSSCHPFSSMTSLLMHNVAHSTRHSFRPKNNNQALKKFLFLAFSWVKVVKNWTSV